MRRGVGAPAALLFLCAAGCAAPAPDRTGGITLELDIRDAGNFAALYRVERDGTLGWGGGESAEAGEVAWQGSMSDAEIKGLQALLEEDRWFESGGSPPQAGSAAGDRQRRTAVRLGWPGGERRFSVEGTSGQVERVVDYLARIARRRYDRFLENLPRPEPGEEQPDL